MSGQVATADVEDTDATEAPTDDETTAGEQDDSSGAAASGGGRSLYARAWPWILVASPIVALAWRGWDSRWMADDGFINLRVVDMITSGHGPVFNVGERVEVTTSTLWLWALVAGEVLLPLELEWIAVLLGLGFTVAALTLVSAASAQLWRNVSGSDAEPTKMWIPVGSAVLAALPPVADYATSGLEGGLTFAWVGAVGWVLARWSRPGVDGERRALGIGAAVLIGLGPLVRPDAAILSAIALVGVLAVQWREGSGWWARGRLLAAAAAVPFVYQIFRMGYYGAVVPNTALAKNASRERWSTGWFYFNDFVDTYWLWLPMLLVLVAVGLPLSLAVRRSRDLRIRVAVAALPLAGVLQAVYIIRVGGDYMHARLLLPALWSWIAPLAVVPLPALRSLAPSSAGLRPAAATGTKLALLGGLAVWVAVCAVGDSMRHPGFRLSPHSVVVDGRGGLVRGLNKDNPVSAESQGWDQGQVDALDADQAIVWAEPRNPLPYAVPPDHLDTPSVALFGVGVVGYAIGPDWYIVDMLGLADPIDSRFVVEKEAQPGHEKVMPSPWLAARLSDEPIDLEVLPRPGLVGPLYESAPGEFEDDVEAARATLSCDTIQELFAAVREPMTPGRFLDNLLAAPRLTRIKIPPEPTEAEEALC